MTIARFHREGSGSFVTSYTPVTACDDLAQKLLRGLESLPRVWTDLLARGYRWIKHFSSG
jgi:hypothetical protein